MAKANTPSSGRKKTPQSSSAEAEKSGPTDNKDAPSPDSQPAEATPAKSGASKAAAGKGAKAGGAKAAKPETSATETADGTDKPELIAAAASAATTAMAGETGKSSDTPDTKTAETATKPASASATTVSASSADKPAPEPVKEKAPADKSQAGKPDSDAPLPPSSKTSTTPSPAASTAAPPPQQRTEPRRSIFWPLVAGGVIAGVLGFAASEMNVLNTRVDTNQIEDTMEAQSARIAALESAEPATPEATDLSGVETSLGALSETIAEMSETVTALEARLAELEDRPLPTAPDGADQAAADYAEAFEALKASIEAQNQEIAAQKAEIDDLITNAQTVEEATADAARAAAVQAALAKVTAAVSSGASYQTAVEELTESGVEDVPEALERNAADGVPALLELQTDFPGAARDALSATRAAGNDGGGDGFGGFLRRQLGARSVAPREGTDPDAVLSRAEDAVRQGRVGDALTEIETLPPEAQAAMEDWIARARARAEAEAAVQALYQRLTAN